MLLLPVPTVWDVAYWRRSYSASSFVAVVSLSAIAPIAGMAAAVVAD
jgi:hypothetical protein